jgi:hypothetical protein
MIIGTPTATAVIVSAQSIFIPAQPDSCLGSQIDKTNKAKATAGNTMWDGFLR